MFCRRERERSSEIVHIDALVVKSGRNLGGIISAGVSSSLMIRGRPRRTTETGSEMKVRITITKDDACIFRKPIGILPRTSRRSRRTSRAVVESVTNAGPPLVILTDMKGTDRRRRRRHFSCTHSHRQHLLRARLRFWNHGEHALN